MKTKREELEEVVASITGLPPGHSETIIAAVIAGYNMGCLDSSNTAKIIKFGVGDKVKVVVDKASILSNIIS